MLFLGGEGCGKSGGDGGGLFLGRLYWHGSSERGGDGGGGLAGGGDGLFLGDAVASVISRCVRYNLLSIIHCYLYLSNTSPIQ